MSRLLRIIQLLIQQRNVFTYKSFGWKSWVKKPLQIDGKRNIAVGKNVFVAQGAWLASMPLTGYIPELVIGDRSVIGHYAHIYATKKITIGKDVLIADKVYIADNLHGYEDINIPIKEQPIIQKREVSIGDNTWIGENVCIIGSSIGRGSVIGANSVVTHDIPDYSVAVGSPAKVIKYYDDNLKKWINVNN